jgi:hypothetical protein
LLEVPFAEFPFEGRLSCAITIALDNNAAKATVKLKPMTRFIEEKIDKLNTFKN